MRNFLLSFLSILLLAAPISARSESDTPSELKGAVIYVENFLGNQNMMLVADVISVKHGALKFRLGQTDYDYSGNFSIYLKTPRQHKSPYFGLGSPETAKLIILDNFFKGNGDGQALLPNATIWEKSDGFIVAVSMGREWIHSGNYTITNSK
jgi:hypothetical protein